MAQNLQGGLIKPTLQSEKKMGSQNVRNLIFKSLLRPRVLAKVVWFTLYETLSILCQNRLQNFYEIIISVDIFNKNLRLEYRIRNLK